MNEVQANDALSMDRERVLALLEAGRLDADEAGELLSALSESPADRPKRLTVGRAMLWMGAAVVLASFPTTWLNVDLAAEMNRMMESLPQVPDGAGLPDGVTYNTTFRGIGLPALQSGKPFEVRGADVPNGLGWTILLLVLLAATAPLAGRHVDRRDLATASLLALLAACAVGVYILGEYFRYCAVGFVLTLTGCVGSLVGALVERNAFRRHDTLAAEGGRR